MATYPIKDQTVVRFYILERASEVRPLSDRMLVERCSDFQHSRGWRPSFTGETTPWVQDVEQQEMLDAYQDDWGRDATGILRQLTKPSRWTLHAMYPPLDSYVRGKIVLIGDAVRQFLDTDLGYF